MTAKEILTLLEIGKRATNTNGGLEYGQSYFKADGDLS